ncbi:MAG: VWA domain-containing protein, partial [Phycisphaeraceae bacterium]
PRDMEYGEESGFEGDRAMLGGMDEGQLKARDLLGDAGRADMGAGDADGDAEGGGESGRGLAQTGGPRAGLLERSPGGGNDFDPGMLRPGSGELVELPGTEPLPALPELDEEAADPQPLDEDFDYTLTRYRPEPGWFNRDVGDGYFRIDVAPRRSLQKLKAMPKDVVFLVDTSSSLPQKWVDAAITGVEASLASLNEGDRFNVVLFKETPQLLTDHEPLPANRASIEKATKFLRGAESRGYTDVNAALRRLLVRDRDRDRVYYLVLISDGRPTRGVMDTRELINLITRDNNLSASIYCVGVGEKQDRELLDFLAYRNKGRSVFVEEVGRTRVAIADLLSKLRYPLIRGAAFSVLGVDGERVFPNALPNIHQGQRLSIYGRYEQRGMLTMRITGMGAEGPVDFLFSLDLDEAREGEASLARNWAKWKLHNLYDRVLREGRTDELVRQIREIEREYDLRTLY